MREAYMPQDVPATTEKLDRNPPAFEAVMQEEREAKTDTEVRQGVTGMGVRYVLGASLTGALVALFVLYAYFTPG